MASLLGWVRRAVLTRALALGASRSLTASMSSTSTSCPAPMLSSSHWSQASCCSYLWVSLPFSKGLLIWGKLSGRLATFTHEDASTLWHLLRVFLSPTLPKVFLFLLKGYIGRNPSGVLGASGLGGLRTCLPVPVPASSSLFTPQSPTPFLPWHMTASAVGDCVFIVTVFQTLVKSLRRATPG